MKNESILQHTILLWELQRNPQVFSDEEQKHLVTYCLTVLSCWSWWCCCCRLGNYEEAHKYFQEAWDRCESEKEQDLQYYSSISVTIKYNTARLHEMFCQYDKAEKLYKEILQDHPNYVDCKSLLTPSVPLRSDRDRWRALG